MPKNYRKTKKDIGLGRSTNGSRKPPTKLQRKLRRFFNSIWVEIAIGILVVLSVGFTLFELSIETERVYQNGILTSSQEISLARLSLLNSLITVVFAVELSLRFYAAASKKHFFKEFWLDIIATVPLFRPLRTARALRLLRLIRLVRLIGVMTRLSYRYPFLFRRGSLDFIVVCGMLFVCVLFGTVAVMYFESHAATASGTTVPKSEQFSFENSFWFSVYTLFAGEPTPMVPETIAGRVVAVFIMFMGLTMFAVFAGTVSAFMVDRIRSEGRVVDWNELYDHVIICGWTSKTEIIIREFRASREFCDTAIVVISQLDTDYSTISNDIRENVIFLHDDFTRVSALERAGVLRAKTVIILADTSNNRSEQDADARTILAALTVEKISPDVQTSAELLHRTYGSHLDLGKVNSYVVSGEYGAYLLAQEAMERGSMGVIDELLTCQRGNEFYRTEIPEKWIGKDFNEAFVEMKSQHRAILVGVCEEGGEVYVNPDEHQFQHGDQVIIIAENQIDLKG